MLREIDLSEISDGKLYTANDMVRIECQECKGCSSCCHDMGESIILDPYDLYQLEKGLHTSFAELMQGKIELHVVDGIIQPNLKMQEGTLQCGFLNSEGRCSIHELRPGFCRLFPLGRIYEGGNFKYFWQIHECAYPNRSKVKIKKWLGIPELSVYENYIRSWHNFLKEVQEIITHTENEEIVRNLNMLVLNEFYVNQYEMGAASFYEQFESRISTVSEKIRMYR